MAPHEDTSTDSQRPRTDPDRHFSQADLHGLGEDPEQHALHSHIESKYIWGLSQQYESLLFYFWFLTSLCLEIAAAAIAPYYKTWRAPFIGTMTAFMVCHWAGWIQTVQGMLQRASWIREESDLETRRQFLRLAVRLNRLQLVLFDLLRNFTCFADNLAAHGGNCATCLHSGLRPSRPHR